ncbi:hypothetical protein BDF14DRAFT_1974347 [Spinellus fusiger]|nr:hypothetical protein BDF14DRAFT_1974347 [Spinellus fusiger]
MKSFKSSGNGRRVIHSNPVHRSPLYSQRKKTSYSTVQLALIFLLILGLISSLSRVQASDDDDREVPRNHEWLDSVNLEDVPDMPVRPVGSGICEDAVCDGSDNDRCFESCGNVASPDNVYGCPDSNQWALTFDDGPSNYTDELLDILDEYHIKATFCVLGTNVKKHPDVIQRIYDSGHQIASHTYSHPHLMSLTNEEIIYEVKATEEAIRDIIGVTPKYIRPPFGEADDRVKGLLKAMGYKILMWNVDPTDYDVYMMPDVDSRIQGAFKKAASGTDTGLNANEDPGFISLQHDLYQQSIEQVPNIIEYLQGKGFILTTPASCTGDDEPHSGHFEESMVGQAVVEKAVVTTIASASATDSSSSSVSSSVSSNPKETKLLSSPLATTRATVSGGMVYIPPVFTWLGFITAVILAFA